jgi:hypothetical protein
MSPGENKPIEVRLGDLDLKTAVSEKQQYWLDTERRLIQEESECTL